MKLTQPKTRHLKFTINDSIVHQYPLTEKVEIKYEAGKEDKFKWFGLRWIIHFLNKQNAEAITQLSESRAIFKLEEAKKDSAELKAFIQNAFVSVQTNFQDKLPASLKHLSIAEPNFDEMSETLMKEILKVK
ncbi:MAG: hypothetical protein ACT4ON_03930 [Bacteroidota bacterium]